MMRMARLTTIIIYQKGLWRQHCSVGDDKSEVDDFTGDHEKEGCKIPAQRRRGRSLTACNAAPPATPHRLQNPKWPPGGPKMAEGVWKGVHP